MIKNGDYQQFLNQLGFINQQNTQLNAGQSKNNFNLDNESGNTQYNNQENLQDNQNFQQIQQQLKQQQANSDNNKDINPSNKAQKQQMQYLQQLQKQRLSDESSYKQEQISLQSSLQNGYIAKNSDQTKNSYNNSNFQQNQTQNKNQVFNNFERILVSDGSSSQSIKNSCNNTNENFKKDYQLNNLLENINLNDSVNNSKKNIQQQSLSGSQKKQNQSNLNDFSKNQSNFYNILVKNQQNLNSDNFNDNNKNNYIKNNLNNEDFDLEFLKQESDLLNGTQQSINISSFIQNQTGRNSLNNNFSQILLCQKHNKPYEICCIKCQEVICTMCAIFDQKKSSQCKFAQLEQVQKEMEVQSQKIKNSMKQISSFQKEIQENKKNKRGNYLQKQVNMLIQDRKKFLEQSVKLYFNQIELEFERKKQKVQNEMEMIFSEIEQATQKNINAQLDTLIYRFQSYIEACDNILKQDELIGEKNEILSKFGLNFKIYNNYKYSMEESKEIQQQMFEFQSENEQKLKQNKIYRNLLQKLDELNFQPDQGIINSIKNLKGILISKQNDNQQQIQQNDQQEIQNLQRSTFTFQGKQSQNQVQMGQNYNKFQQQEMSEKIVLQNNLMNFSQQSDFSHPEQINSSQNQNNNSYNNISGINMQEQFGESIIEEDQYQNLNQGQNQFYDQDQIRSNMDQKNKLKNDKNKNNDTNQQQHIQNQLQQTQFRQQQQMNCKNYNQALLDSTCSTFYNGQNGNQNQKKDSGKSQKSQKSLLSGKNQPKQIQKSTSAFNILVGQKQKKNIINSGQNNKKPQQLQQQGNTNPTQKCKKFELESDYNQNQTLNQKFSNQQQQQQFKQLSGSFTARNLPVKNFQKLGNCNTSRDNSQKSSQTLNQIHSAKIPSRKLNKSSSMHQNTFFNGLKTQGSEYNEAINSGNSLFDKYLNKTNNNQRQYSSKSPQNTNQGQFFNKNEQFDITNSRNRGINSRASKMSSNSSNKAERIRSISGNSSNYKLTKNLLHKQLNPKLMQVLVDLENQNQAKVLEIMNQGLSDRDMDYLVGYLEQYPQQINSIKLLKNKITDVGFQRILGFLSKNTTVSQLNLLQNNISVRALDLIGQYLQENSTLKEIILIKNDPGLIKEKQKIMILQQQLGIFVQVKQ